MPAIALRTTHPATARVSFGAGAAPGAPRAPARAPRAARMPRPVAAAPGGGASAGYQVRGLERIASGNSSVVYRGMLNQKPVAVKHMVRRHRSYGLFRNEVECLKMVQDSPNVVRYLDSFWQQENMYIITELVEGPTLTEYTTAHGPLPEYRARELAFGILDVIRLCHRFRFIYSDLKPENVMVDRYGRARLVDFGCMRPYGFVLPHYLGTPLSFSPEMLDRVLLPTYDTWGLGILIYGMATGGAHPFLPGVPSQTIASMEELRASILRNGLCLAGAPWDDWTPAGRELMSQLLEKDPFVRPTVEEVFAHPWFDAMKK